MWKKRGILCFPLGTLLWLVPCFLLVSQEFRGCKPRKGLLQRSSYCPVGKERHCECIFLSVLLSPSIQNEPFCRREPQTLPPSCPSPLILHRLGKIRIPMIDAVGTRAKPTRFASFSPFSANRIESVRSNRSIRTHGSEVAVAGATVLHHRHGGTWSGL